MFVVVVVVASAAAAVVAIVHVNGVRLCPLTAATARSFRRRYMSIERCFNDIDRGN
jgi:hypothetical protein